MFRPLISANVRSTARRSAPWKSRLTGWPVYLDVTVGSAGACAVAVCAAAGTAARGLVAGPSGATRTGASCTAPADATAAAAGVDRTARAMPRVRRRLVEHDSQVVRRRARTRCGTATARDMSIVTCVTQRRPRVRRDAHALDGSLLDGRRGLHRRRHVRQVDDQAMRSLGLLLDVARDEAAGAEQRDGGGVAAPGHAHVANGGGRARPC